MSQDALRAIIPSADDGLFNYNGCFGHSYIPLEHGAMISALLYFVERNSKLGKAMLCVNTFTHHRRQVALHLAFPVKVRQRRRRLRWFGWLCFGLLVGYLLFAYGCHGEEEDDLVLQHIKVGVPRSATELPETRCFG